MAPNLSKMATDISNTSDNNKITLDIKTGARFGRCQGDVLSHVTYRPISNIHQGDTAQVFLMEHRERAKEFLAAKVFNLDDEDFADKYWEIFKREVGILQELDHEHIIKCRMAIASPTLGVIFMDYVPEGTIRQHLLTSPLLHKNVHRYFIQISTALRQLHCKRIVHRDISLDNILVKNNTAFLAGFGSARKLPADSSNTFGLGLIGTLGFQAPEVLRASLATTSYDGLKADSYALGVVLWCLLTKEEPDRFIFNIRMRSDMDSKKSNGGDDIVLSEAALGLLAETPDKRWSVATMLETLKRRDYHAWYIDALSK